MRAKRLSKCRLTIWILVSPQEELTIENVLGDGRFCLNLPSKIHFEYTPFRNCIGNTSHATYLLSPGMFLPHRSLVEKRMLVLVTLVLLNQAISTMAIGEDSEYF